MGELDEISYKIGQLTSAFKIIQKQNDTILEKIECVPVLEQRLTILEAEVEKIKNNVVLGGTTTVEKVGIWGQVLILVARFASKILGVPLPF